MRKHLELTHGSLKADHGLEDKHIKLLKDIFNLRIHARRGKMTLQGEDEDVALCELVVGNILEAIDRGLAPTEMSIRAMCDLHLAPAGKGGKGRQTAAESESRQLGRTEGQARYVEAMRASSVTFATGPAGTGKTYLAVGMAVQYLMADAVQRIVLVRPAVEAGEKLGFLPGDLNEKIRPYLLPIYDSLRSFLGPTRLESYQEREIIEVAPLAYMRGRTLDASFMILDEAQNTTVEQMKMFLTRIGKASRAVITGDTTQIDLPQGETSGLVHAKKVLRDIEDIAFVELSTRDIVRHPVVGRIVEAYEKYPV